MTTHILFACDFSKATDTAFEYMRGFALAAGARVSLLHVYESLGPGLEAVYQLVDPDFATKVETTLIKLRGDVVERLRRQLNEVGLESEVIYQHGHAGEQIVKAALRHDCDLIVIGSQSQCSGSPHLLGSTSNYVLHHSPIPVLLIPQLPAAPRLATAEER